MERLSLARRLSKPGFSILVALYAGGIATAQTLPRGQIVDDVQCVDDETQHYSLYLASTFTPTRKWPIILAFDAGGRGRRGVERYQAGAEQFPLEKDPNRPIPVPRILACQRAHRRQDRRIPRDQPGVRSVAWQPRISAFLVAITGLLVARDRTLWIG